MTDAISRAADDILALINSKPRSPLKSEIEDIIRLHLPVRPEGYLVTQEQFERALADGTVTIWNGTDNTTVTFYLALQ